MWHAPKEDFEYWFGESNDSFKMPHGEMNPEGGSVWKVLDDSFPFKNGMFKGAKVLVFSCTPPKPAGKNAFLVILKHLQLSARCR